MPQEDTEVPEGWRPLVSEVSQLRFDKLSDPVALKYMETHRNTDHLR
jgi:hypothetical protein